MHFFLLTVSVYGMLNNPLWYRWKTKSKRILKGNTELVTATAANWIFFIQQVFGTSFTLHLGKTNPWITGVEKGGYLPGTSSISYWEST